MNRNPNIFLRPETPFPYSRSVDHVVDTIRAIAKIVGISVDSVVRDITILTGYTPVNHDV